MKIVVIDNYDSFAYNVVQSVGALGAQVELCRRDQVDADHILALQADAVIFASGPGSSDALNEASTIIATLDGRLPILGISFGHQAVAAAYGGRITTTTQVMHGKACEVFHDREGLFRELPSPIVAGCYHSAVVDPASLSDQLVVCARTADQVVMAIRHRRHPVFGVQFHPESVLTPQGPALMEQFLRQAQREVA